MLASPDQRVEQGARNTVEMIFDELVRHPDSGEPRRYTNDAVRARAERDVVGDLAQDARLGFTHSEADAAAYRARYHAAFLAAWRDDAFWRERKALYKPRGYIIVCMR